MADWQSMTVLITGASSGIGLELARLCSSANHQLVLTARNIDSLNQLAGDLRSRSANVDVIPADLSTESGVTDLVAELDRRGMAVDILINNAGFGTHGRFCENDLDQERALLQVNVVALVTLTRLLLPGMIVRGRGRILNVASTAAFVPGPLMANYYASKAYVLSFSEALANELKGTGVTITALCPGPTATNFQARAGMAQSRLAAVAGLSAADVAKVGYDAMMAGKRVAIPGVKNRLIVAMSRFMPRTALAAFVRKLNESR
jgi:short-subunit dehydrogenase